MSCWFEELARKGLSEDGLAEAVGPLQILVDLGLEFLKHRKATRDFGYDSLFFIECYN